MLRLISKRASGLTLSPRLYFGKAEETSRNKKWLRFFRGNERPLIDLQRSIKGETEITTSLASFLYFQQQRFTIKELVAVLSQFKVEAIRLGIDQELVYKTFLQRMTRQEALKLKANDFGAFQSMQQDPSDGSEWLQLLQDNDLLVLGRKPYLAKVVLVQTHHLFPSLPFPQQLQLLLLALRNYALDLSHLDIFLEALTPSALQALSLSDQKRCLQLIHLLGRLFPSQDKVSPDLTNLLVDLYLKSVSSLDLENHATDNGVYLDSLACPQLSSLCSREKYSEYQQLVTSKLLASQDTSVQFQKSTRDLTMVAQSEDLLRVFSRHDDQSLLRLVNHSSHLQPKIRLPLDVETLYVYGTQNLNSSLLLSQLDQYIHSCLEHRQRPKFYRNNGYEPTAELLTKMQQMNLLFACNFVSLQKQLPHPLVAHKVGLSVALLEQFLVTLFSHTNQVLRRHGLVSVLNSVVSKDKIYTELYRNGNLDFFAPSFFERFGNIQEIKQSEQMNRLKSNLQHLMSSNEEHYAEEMDRLFLPISNVETYYHRQSLRTLYVHQQMLELLANYLSVASLPNRLKGPLDDCFAQLCDFHLGLLRQNPFLPGLFSNMFRLDRQCPTLFSSSIKEELAQQKSFYDQRWGGIKSSSGLLDWTDKYCKKHSIAKVVPQDILSSRFFHSFVNRHSHFRVVSPQDMSHRKAVAHSKDADLCLLEEQDLLAGQFSQKHKSNLVNFLLDQPWAQSLLNTSILKKQVEVVLTESESELKVQQNHLDFPFFVDFLVDTGEEKLAILVMEKDKASQSSPFINSGYWQQCARHFQQQGYTLNRVYYDDFNIEPKAFLQNILNRRKKNLQREDLNEVKIQSFEEEQVRGIREEHVRKQKGSKQVQVEVSEEVLNIIEFQ